jgi:hypothetical protein
MRNAELNRIALAGCKVVERKVFLFWPLIRACIRAKRVHHFRSGRDRAIERGLYSDILPAAITHRIGKGAGRDMLVRFDYKALASRLEDGALCNHQIIIRERLRAAMSGPLDYDLSFALVRAVAVADWMAQYED